MKKIIYILLLLIVPFSFLSGCSLFGESKKYYDMNQSFTYNDVEFKITNLREGQSFTTTTGSTETTENYFIFIDIWMKNNGKNAFDVRTSTFSIVIKETEQVISYYPGYTYLYPNNIVRAELNPTFSGSYSPYIW